LQTTHVCVVDKDGNQMHEGSALSEAAALELYINKHCKSWNIHRIVFATGQLSAHFFHRLKASGLPIVCIDARHAHGVLKAQRIKSDKNNARGLAQIARTGWYNAVHVKSSESQNLHTLIAERKQLVETRLTLENHIRGTLKTFGIKLGTVFSKNMRRENLPKQLHSN